MTQTSAPPERSDELSTIWYTRCPVPTASGLAYSLGWLGDALAASGLAVGILQDGPPELARHHYDHRLIGLFREGGNVPALAARSEGAPTRLIGLTWIDEAQTILVRPDSPITSPERLRGVRVAVPEWAATKGLSFPRAMALHGYAGALSIAGLTLDDVQFVEVPTVSGLAVRSDYTSDGSGWWRGIEALAKGEVDAVYVKGAAAVEDARRLGVVVGIDLDTYDDRRVRVNNGTPRPITVHSRLLDERPDVVTAFLAQTLRAADWAVDHVDEVRAVLQRETRSGPEGVLRAYGDTFHLGLHPTLADDRLELLAQQSRFLEEHGFLAAPVDVFAWADHQPLRRAHLQLAREKVA
jgi:ABC-type nitrate/sulfonate/bicarbonate transport system substrate-binding protein